MLSLRAVHSLVQSSLLIVFECLLQAEPYHQNGNAEASEIKSEGEPLSSRDASTAISLSPSPS